MTNHRSDMNYAAEQDRDDELAAFRDQFHIPKRENLDNEIYLCGNSLGLQPKSTREFIEQELAEWELLGVRGHFAARRPWMPYHEFLTEKTAELVGAKPSEVVNMNSLTANLHFMMVSFYRPTKTRYKLLIESPAFPSDRYATESQVRFHGFDPKDAVVMLATIGRRPLRMVLLAVPIAIHLIGRRRAKVVRFAALDFLLASKRKTAPPSRP